MAARKIDAAAAAWWHEHGVDPKAKPSACPFCGHVFCKPCSEQQHGLCANYVVVQRKAKAK